MQFFYTGADFYLGTQVNIDKSLGGFLSISPVPNNVIDNVFSDVSLLGQIEGSVETKGIILKNTTGVAVTNVLLYQTYPANVLVKMEYAAVTLIGGQQMEKIPSFRATPYTGNFVEPTGIGNQVVLTASLGINEAIGIWIRRTVTSPPPADSIAASALEAYQAALLKTETIDVVLSWT